MDARLKHPFNMFVCGPTQSGKTSWVKRLIKHADALFENPPRKIRWYSPHPDPPLPEVIHRRKLPWEEGDEEEEEEDGDEIGGADLLVFDDFALKTANSKEMTDFLTRISHHQGTSMILLSQNLFWRGDETQNQSRNMHYITLMRQMRDFRQIKILGRQITQSTQQYDNFMLAYNDAMDEKPYAYLLISMHPRDDRRLLLRTNIFPEEGGGATTVYLTSEKSINRRGSGKRGYDYYNGEKKTAAKKYSGSPTGLSTHTDDQAD